MDSARFIVKRFASQKYTAVFNPNSGFFARIEDANTEEPFWSHHGPELLDIAITNWCDKGCSFCYRKSDRLGTHMALSDFYEILRQARELHVFQIALGGGNPNQHPDFEEFLRLSRVEFGIVPNYTTNGRGLSGSVVQSTADYCGAVAVSAYPPYTETSEAVSLLTEHGISTNIHFLLTSKSIDTAIEWLQDPPEFLEKANAIVFLNYKPIGRNPDTNLLLNRSPKLSEFFESATSKRYPFRIGFDTCCITGLARLGKSPEVCLEGCDAGRFSLFISETLEVYPCSFMVETQNKGVSLRNSSMADIWRQHRSLVEFRSKHRGSGCSTCSTPKLCLSGCPLFPEMNLCPENCCNS
ncbi:MAG: radical SAM protein [Opitutaceae bacterium]